MTKLEKIERQIAELDPADQQKLLEWLANHRAQAEDEGTEDPDSSGRLRLLRELKGSGVPRSAMEIDAFIRHVRGDE